MTSIFIAPPSNLTIVGVDVNNDYAGFAGLRRLAAMLLESYRPDVFVDLHNVLRTKVLAVLFRVHGVPSVRIFKPRAKRRALTRPHNKVMLPLLSQRARYREAFSKAGFPMTENFDGLYDGRGKADTADFAAITTPKPSGSLWIGIAPFAAHGGKIYPPELMEKVLARLHGLVDNGKKLKVFLFGGGNDEQEILGRWEREYPYAVSLAGKKYGFKAELALLNHIDVAVTMDSANMHLAAIAGTPTLSIWGATHPYCGFKAWRQADADTVQLPLDCRPCSVFGDKPCLRGDNLCMAAIKPELIYNKIIKKTGLAQ